MARTKKPKAVRCVWTWNDDGYWDGACGITFYFDDASAPAESGWRWCPKCGGSLTEKKP